MGLEMFISDGTNEGTELLKNINAYHQDMTSESDNSSNPENLNVFGDKLIFVANDDVHGYEPWVTDGTPDGTYLLMDILPENYGSNDGSNPGSFTAYNNDVFFLANTWSGRQLFISDGTSGNTHIVKEVTGGNTGGGSIIYKNKLYYNYSESIYGSELWCSDGTESGTLMLKDSSGSVISEPSNFFEYNNKLYFSAESDSSGWELWVTDGTNANTKMFKNINLKKNAGSSPSKFIVMNNNLYFTARDSAHGRELWCTNGDTVYLVKDICADCGGLDYSTLHVYNNTLYFQAKDSSFSDQRLWTSDGTEQGTFELLASDSTSVVDPQSFVNWHNLMIFKAKKQNTWDNQLWMTDGTMENTKQIFPDSVTGWSPMGYSELVVFNDEIYFSAGFNDSIGTELYKLVIDTTSSTINTINIPAINNNIQIYPNPFKDQLTIECDQTAGINKIQLIDIGGRVLFTKKSYSGIQKLNTAKLKSGMYLLSVENSRGKTIRKIIKE